MSDKPVKIPGPDHPITVEKNPDRVVVKVAGRSDRRQPGRVVAAGGQLPGRAVHPSQGRRLDGQLERTDHESYCPYKGDASYYSIVPAGEQGVNAVWTYEKPYDAVADIRDHVAFYPDRVDSIEILAD